MTILHEDGRSEKAVLLSQERETIRVMVAGDADAREYRQTAGAGWLGESGEVVTVQYEWQGSKRTGAPAEADCVCSKQLAAELIRMLRNPEVEEEKPGLLMAIPAGIAYCTALVN
jgi:hypothetical protein